MAITLTERGSNSAVFVTSIVVGDSFTPSTNDFISADTITATHGSSRPSTLLLQLSGTDVSGTVSNAIIQKVKATGYDQRTSLALGTLTALTSANILLTLGQNYRDGNSFSPQTNFTEIQDLDLGQFQLGSFLSTTSETAPTLNYERSTFTYTGGICAEIKAAGGGGTILFSRSRTGFRAGSRQST